ncbi:hypothetical protein J8C01_13390 [Chloracidobacterium sp. D]|jgi:hypothetical protein|uniref:hypothetical protein n=1 Tax=Chloracidobacterium sp. D TaxID=2821536 RepID=UPI001B8CBF26|nr:hypothetical protein [Chloracidobacterium sp. D]QUV82925.1 hypothetical protein J8C01_13390 [Chloracidobacterium sp. D]
MSASPAPSGPPPGKWHQRYPRLKRAAKWTGLMAGLAVLLLVTWEWVVPLKQKVQLDEWWCRMRSVPCMSVMPSLTVEMALEFDQRPPEQWMDHLFSIPPPMRFFVLRINDPDTTRTLLTLLEEKARQRFPQQEAVVRSLFAKTAELYRLQDAPPNNPNALRLFREVGADWLQELTPEEKNLALALHREWFHPSLHLRHRNQVWILPASVPVIKGWLARYEKLQEDIDPIPFSPFPGDPGAPDFATRYETDGLFAAPRLASCDCATDVDCMPGSVCRIPTPPAQPDTFTVCHLLGVIIPCEGKCAPAPDGDALPPPPSPPPSR